LQFRGRCVHRSIPAMIEWVETHQHDQKSGSATDRPSFQVPRETLGVSDTTAVPFGSDGKVKPAPPWLPDQIDVINIPLIHLPAFSTVISIPSFLITS
jgi:hypothetical protein